MLSINPMSYPTLTPWSPLPPQDLAGQRCYPLDPVSCLPMAAQTQALELRLMSLFVRLLEGLMAGAPTRGLNVADSGGGAAQTAADALNQSSSSSGNDTAPPAGLPKIGPGTKVLEIGDSHTVGAYGQELEKLLEGKGATVTKDAVGGTATYQWLHGTAKTHKLDDLVMKDKPDVVIINLGANQRTQKPGSDVRRLAEMAHKAGAQVIWVGPPTTREDMKNPVKLKEFDDEMRAALGGSATYISSAPYTPRYVGSDGIHYSSGAAQQWAQGIFRAITGG